jgi:hypothetical protein
MGNSIIFQLGAIFLDAREFVSYQVGSTKVLPELQLWYTTKFIGVGRIPMHIMGIPLEQFGALHQRGMGGTMITADSTISGDKMF